MAPPAPFLSSSPVNTSPWPALYLYPLNESFVPKHITLSHGQHVKVGRQTNAKTSPAERNGYFDSKVLSRQHAEVWEEDGKIYIKDVKSSNGTFINGERLSPESVESEPFELKSDDIVEFGIDIVGEDNKTIIHHKVAARVLCIFTEQDAQVAARAEQHRLASAATVGGPAAGGAGPSAATGQFSFAGGGGGVGQPGAPQRRPPVQAQGLGGMGGMGGGMRAPGKSGLTFDHILSRLQGELQKSRETGAELHTLTGTMSEIHDTLGGQLPSNLPPYPQTLPPVRSNQPQNPSDGASTSSDHSGAAVSGGAPLGDLNARLHSVGEIQAQLQTLQGTLAAQVEKAGALETLLAEHDAIKREMSSLRALVEDRKREMEAAHEHREHHDEERLGDNSEHHPLHDPHQPHERDFGVVDDDASSVHTVMPHELERVDEEDEEQLAAEQEEDDRRRRREEVTRPRTPEPTGMGIQEDDEDPRHAHRVLSSSAPPPASSLAPSVVDALTERLAALATQLQSAVDASSALQAQHAAAQSTISSLESKVAALEELVATTQRQMQVREEEAARRAAAEAEAEAAAAAAAPQPGQDSSSEGASGLREETRDSLLEILNEWRKNVEGQWTSVREEWHVERERLHRARQEWEERVRVADVAAVATAARVDAGLAALEQQHPRHRASEPHGHGRRRGAGGSGLVTPPSPRSLSADSGRSRARRRRASGGSSPRGGRSRSQSPVGTDSTAVEEGADGGAGVLADGVSKVSVEGPCTCGADALLNGHAHVHQHADDELSDAEDGGKSALAAYPTPAASVHQAVSPAVAKAGTGRALPLSDLQLAHASTAAGVLILGVAAAAVLWRVKPE